MYPIHENETGSFQELARANDVIFGQLSYLTIRPKCSRGNHYHTHKEEWFCCLHGRCELKLIHVKEGIEKRVVLDSSRREFVKVNPFENHILTNLDDAQDCKLLIIISQEYYPETADTFRLEDGEQ